MKETKKLIKRIRKEIKIIPLGKTRSLLIDTVFELKQLMETILILQDSEKY